MQETEILLAQALSSLNYPVVFRANLNAFIGSARSITSIMQKEFSSRPGFKEWYGKKQEKMRLDELLRLFINLRNESLKERPLADKIN